MAVNNKKLTDFFKPQETTKQKNILQFFAKSQVKDAGGSLVKTEDELILAVNKENTGSRVPVQTCDELNTEVVSLLEDSNDDLSHATKKKKKKKKKEKDNQDNSAAGDSAGNSKSVANENKKSAEYEKVRDHSENKCTHSSNEENISGGIVKEENAVAESLDYHHISAESCSGDQEISNTGNTESPTLDEANNGQKAEQLNESIDSEFKHPKDVKSIKGGSRLRKTSGGSNTSKKLSSTITENEEPDNENLPRSRASKRNALCGKEMMSLLKEIKDADDSTGDDKKKKKHKNKKKHKSKHREKVNGEIVTDKDENEVSNMPSLDVDDSCSTSDNKDLSSSNGIQASDSVETNNKSMPGGKVGRKSKTKRKDKVKKIVLDADDVPNGDKVTTDSLETANKLHPSENLAKTPKNKKKTKPLDIEQSPSGGIAKFFTTSTPNGKKQTTNSDSFCDFATPEPIKKPRKSVIKLESDASDVTSDDVTDTDPDTTGETGERRRSLRKKYKVSVFQMDEERRTPIKIKLRRCPVSNTSLGELDQDTEKKKTVKAVVKTTISKASELLKKAKKSSKKSRTAKDEKKKKVKEKHGSSRVSARLKDKTIPSMEEVSLDAIVLLSDDEDEKLPVKSKRGRKKKKDQPQTNNESNNTEKDSGEEVKKQTKLTDTPKRASLKKINKSSDNKDNTPCKKTATPNKGMSLMGTPKKGTPRKGTPRKGTPKKAFLKDAAVSDKKIHPMFLTDKKSAENESKKPTLSAAEMKQRQDFLMSGIPSELKKQCVVRSTNCVLDYPPFPQISHVLQIPDINDKLNKMWNMMGVTLNISAGRVVPSIVYPRSRFLGDLVKRYEKPSDRTFIKEFSGHSDIDEKMMEKCVQEVECYNTAYPARKMFSKLKQLREDWKQTLQSKGSESEMRTSMAGILSECVEEKKLKTPKKSRRSLKLSKETSESTADVTVVEAVKEPEKTKSAGPVLLWTDKYSPCSCSDVLGNNTVMKKLRTWLEEWKRLLDKERKKACKMLLKKKKRKAFGSAADSDSDTSDFDMDSEDSEDDDSTCNTMLLTGPHGSGKTSSVYALAQELSFKVHEVNASSSRNGKHLLCQLQEATQSHQVAGTGSNTPSKLPVKPKLAVKSEAPKMPTAFTNLFKKDDTNKQTESTGEKGKKRKRNKSDKDASPKQKRPKIQSLAPVVIDTDSNITASLNLSSTTLILFDEVDVIFKEDTGFLSAIQTFMASTKIPIILTTADPSFVVKFDGRYEQIPFKRPSMVNLTSHLQTVALVEGVRTDPVLLSEMVQLYGQDVRKCLLALQWLVRSGGSQAQTCRPLAQPASMPETGCAVSQLKSDIVIDKNDLSDPDDDDFVALKPVRKRRRIADDDSNSVDVGLFQGVKGADMGHVLDEACTAAAGCPPVHQLGLEPFLASCTANKETLTQQLLRCLAMQSSVSVEEMVQLCKVIHSSTRSPFIFNNIHILSPLRTCVSDTVIQPDTQSVNLVSSKKRKRIKNDLYDSEESNSVPDSEGLEGSQLPPVSTECDNTGKCVSGISNKLLVTSLSAFSDFYDCMSEMDEFETKLRMSSHHQLENCACNVTRGRLIPGLENELSGIQCSYDLEKDMCYSYMSEIEVRSACRLHSRLAQVKSEEEQEGMSESLSEQLVLPVRKQDERLSLNNPLSNRLTDGPQRAYSSVRSNLPDHLLCSHRNVQLDYLPVIRNMCRTEQARQLTNTKRRFHHYFDSIGLHMKEKSMGMLATTFL